MVSATRVSRENNAMHVRARLLFVISRKKKANQRNEDYDIRFDVRPKIMPTRKSSTMEHKDEKNAT